MSRFLPRFSIRLLMILVAISGLALVLPIAVSHRRLRLIAIAADHEAKARQYGWSGESRFGSRRIKPVAFSAEERAVSDLAMSKAVHHRNLAWKSLASARKPWLPIDPDPAEPN